MAHKAIRNYETFLQGRVSVKIHNYKNSFEVVILIPKGTANACSTFSRKSRMIDIELERLEKLKGPVVIRKKFSNYDTDVMCGRDVAFKVENDIFNGMIFLRPALYQIK